MTPEMERQFGFEPLSDREELDKKEEQELKLSYKNVAEAAAECLNSEMFAKYKAAFADFRDKAIRVCAKVPTSNPNEYAFVVHELMCKLDMLQYLEDLIKLDIKRGE